LLVAASFDYTLLTRTQESERTMSGQFRKRKAVPTIRKGTGPMTHSPLLFDSSLSDGYVRVPEIMLARLTLVHVSSGIDEGLLADLRADAIDALDAGYTEWQGAIHSLTLQVSIGWDWYIDGASGAFLIAWGDVRSNLMGVDHSGTDVGMVRTAGALAHRLMALNWSDPVAATVALALKARHHMLSSFQRQ
jgi:hypothetical protein